MAFPAPTHDELVMRRVSTIATSPVYVLAFLAVIIEGAIDSSVMKCVADINDKGPYLGLVIPNAFELYPFLNTSIFTLDSTIDISGRRFHVGEVAGRRVLAVMTGLGMLNTGITTQLLLTYFDISGVLHYGIAGNADDELNIGDITIPRYWAHTGLWEWERYAGESFGRKLFRMAKGEFIEAEDLGCLEIGNYNDPRGNGSNMLSKICYEAEEVLPVNGTPETVEQHFWVPVDESYYQIAAQITSKSLNLKRCTNESNCLSQAPQVVTVSRGVSANIFVDNAAYRSFLHDHFNVSLVDEESAGVALTCLTNNVSFIAFRALSDLAGGSDEANEAEIFYNLAATNAVIVLTAFIRMLPLMAY
ncbi:hypothetical protein GOP47_0015460 [Adiantum capillus-veneris]|uniref:Nucleoside phosphorylase domain-containing protein n=1 Tax=Adiantum capillus-veneris TaxID=13818 RepID=A0A9D4ZBP0_ADICA|nr:hypothetical protein GOP47_0015460 [Adiantum capillus-veneris]